ncbi:MAG: response regulator [Calditrichae bacterium]|nr:response regulator [Calditrichota bacterium]MCB9058675.1 response regulator [Calditrichia bacterium]
MTKKDNSRKKILFVDDDDILREAYCAILEKKGFDVTAVHDGSYVKGALNKKKFDAVITDIVMPNKEGLETIKDIREIDKNVPILAISGGGRISPHNHLKLAKIMGASDALYKPFDGDTLISKINELL